MKILKYAEKLFGDGIFLLVLVVLAFANWFWPLYSWFGDTTLYRFIWLGIFFVLLDIFIEVIVNALKEVSLIAESLSFSRDIKKISEGFSVLSKVMLPNGLAADFVVVGSSGVWLVMVEEDGGEVIFNGDDIVQNGKIRKGLLTRTLEKSFALADYLKKHIQKDFKVVPVLAFSSPHAKLASAPKVVRGVYLTAGKDAVSLIENTDAQLIDKNSSQEIYELLKKPLSSQDK